MTLVYPRDDFQAYLTAVLETWLHRAPEWTIAAESDDWFPASGPQRSVRADGQAARRIAEGVKAHAGARAWLVLSLAFRHADRGKEAVLAEFVRLCVRHGESTLDHLDPEVCETLRRARAVRAEAHRFVGLVRFRAVDGGWYARFEPDHDVLGLLVEPFQKRMEGYDWMLHDEGRQAAWVCRAGVGEGVRGVRVSAGPGRDPDADVQDLWRLYFRTTAVPERINLGLQRSKMPHKTWKNLVEKG